MKKMNFLKMIAILIAMSLSSCTNVEECQEPEDVGFYAFNILENLSETTKADYVNNFITFEELEELVESEENTTDQDTYNRWKLMKKEKLIDIIEDGYNDVKHDAGENGIKWDEIEYLDFVYELEDENGMTMCEGKLYFIYQNTSYSVYVDALFDGKEYKLTEIDYLDEHEKLNP